jgi:GNAT superfamily N-acetyltransferase
MENKRYHILPITETQMPSAGTLLAEAFFADPLIVSLFPDTQERTRLLTWYYTATVRALAPFQGIYTTAGSVKGVAVWDPPGTKEEAPEWTEQAGAGAYRHFLKVIDSLTSLRQSAVSHPFWYLSWIGVASTHQRKGLGSALLAPVLLQADQAGLSCYLETFEQKNLLFYQRHGFEIVFAQIEPESNVPFWMMKREPREFASV